MPLPSPGQDVVSKYSEQQLLEGKPEENKQPGWISAQPKLAPCLEEVTVAQEMGEDSRELFSTRL